MRETGSVRRAAADDGYLMVALLVAMSVMGIMMAAALPAYHTMAQREKEAELVFRGEQIARAIGLYQRRVANASPPSIDFLVEQKYLRKKYKDPITNDDFEPLTSASVGGGAPGAVEVVQRAQALLQEAQGRAGVAAQGRGGGAATQGRGGAVVGGIIGVTSKSPLKSFRLYNDRDTYNQWVFMPVARGRVGGEPGGRGADGRGGRGADGRGRGGDGRGGRSGLDGLFERGRGAGDGRGAPATSTGR